MKNQISGILDGLIKKIAPFFLYIFIPVDAHLSTAVMAKRKKQMALLALIEKMDITRNFEKYIALIRAGIIEKYKLQPEQVLSILYNVASKNISGIGSYFDGCDWVDETTGEALPPEEQQAATTLANDIQRGSASSFITDFKEIVDWIVELLVMLGLTKKTTDYTGSNPDVTDWNLDTGATDAGMGGTLPYVIGAGLVYYLYSKTKK